MSGAAFDSYAKTYDAEFTDTGIGRAQRARVWKYLNKEITTQSKVLEVSCGTGVDAFEFAGKVNSWHATDASQEMVNVCFSKLSAESKNELSFSIKEASRISDFGSNIVDIVFSNFAGLNCLAPTELVAFAEQSAHVLKPKGKLVLVFLGKKCVWENLYFLFKNDARFRRRQVPGGVLTEIEGHQFQTYYYSPHEVAACFKHFHVKRSVGIGLFIPPSFMIRHFPEKSWALNLLKFFEVLCTPLKGLANYSDHFLLVLEKKA